MPFGCCSSSPSSSTPSQPRPAVAPVTMTVDDPKPWPYAYENEPRYVKPEEMNLIEVRDVKVSPVLNWSMTEDYPDWVRGSTTFEIIEKQVTEGKIHFDEYGAKFEEGTEGLVFTNSIKIPNEDDPRTIMIDIQLRKTFERDRSSFLCYSIRNGKGTSFDIIFDWKLDGEIVLEQGPYVSVRTGIKVDLFSFTRLVMVYYGRGKVRFFSNSFEKDSQIKAGNSAIMPRPLKDERVNFGVGAFAQPCPFVGIIRRVLVFDRILDPNAQNHREWFYDDVPRNPIDTQ